MCYWIIKHSFRYSLSVWFSSGTVVNKCGSFSFSFYNNKVCVHAQVTNWVLVTYLDDDDLFDVQKELIPVSAKWRSIGIALRLKPNILDGIKAENSGDPPACLTSTVTEWLKRNYNVKRFGEPTWQKLVEAVAHPTGGANMALARDMARKYKAGGMFS